MSKDNLLKYESDLYLKGIELIDGVDVVGCYFT